MSGKAGLTTVSVYTLIILGVMVYSGELAEKTLYDKYLISVDGIELHVRDFAKSSLFYDEVLNFAHLRSGSNTQTRRFMLPDNSQLLLNPAQDGQPTHRGTVVIRVKNGIDKLQRELKRRLKKTAKKPGLPVDYLASASIGEITKRAWGKEFTAVDPDGNSLVFYYTGIAHRTRYGTDG